MLVPGHLFWHQVSISEGATTLRRRWLRLGAVSPATLHMVDRRIRYDVPAVEEKGLLLTSAWPRSH